MDCNPRSRPFVIDRATLDRLAGWPIDRLHPRQAAEVAWLLRGLARWWLRPEVLRIAATAPESAPFASDWTTLPRLLAGPGDCWTLFALQDSALPALRPALVLPLRWRRDQPTSPFLPPSLRDVADQVLGVLRDDGKNHGLNLNTTWGLHPASWNDNHPLDLSRLDGITSRSAWASLAGGLILAASTDGDARPDPSVWATGCWDLDRGIQPVDLLPAKLALAREWDARTLFVPASQVEQARAELGDTPMTVEALREGTPSAWEALADYRNRLDAPPGPTDSFDRRRRYYLRQPGEKVEGFYRTHLLPDLIRFYRAQVEARWPDRRVSHLVTLISDGAPELVPIAVGAFRPHHVWLLHTSDPRMTGIKDRVIALLDALRDASIPPDVHLHPLDFTGEEQLRTTLPDRLQTLDPIPGRRLLDVTLGTKLMSLVLDTLARPEHDLTLYWSHQRLGSRAHPGSQRLLYRDSISPWTPLGPSLLDAPA